MKEKTVKIRVEVEQNVSNTPRVPPQTQPRRLAEFETLHSFSHSYRDICLPLISEEMPSP